MHFDNKLLNTLIKVGEEHIENEGFCENLSHIVNCLINSIVCFADKIISDQAFHLLSIMRKMLAKYNLNKVICENLIGTMKSLSLNGEKPFYNNIKSNLQQTFKESISISGVKIMDKVYKQFLHDRIIVLGCIHYFADVSTFEGKHFFFKLIGF